MLLLVLLLVLAALGLLVAALVTSTSLYAWISIALSIAAALALFVDWLRRRRAERRAAEDPAADATDDAEIPADDAEIPADDVEKPADDAEKPADDAEKPADDAEKPAEEEPTKVLASTEAPEEPAEDPDAIPGEEDTDAADLLIVCELQEQVIVVDEHPRYHLAECRWLAEKDTIPIAAAEARELGFTPCARCGPDAKLAEAARRKRVAGKS